MRVDFEKEDYTAGNHCKVFASPTENLGLDSVKNADKKPGEARFFFWDIRWRDGQTFKRLDPIDYNLDDEIQIRDIAFFIRLLRRRAFRRRTSGFIFAQRSGSDV